MAHQLEPLEQIEATRHTCAKAFIDADAKETVADRKLRGAKARRKAEARIELMAKNTKPPTESELNQMVDVDVDDPATICGNAWQDWHDAKVQKESIGADLEHFTHNYFIHYSDFQSFRKSGTGGPHHE